MSKALFENMSDELRNLSREMSAIEEFKGNVKDVEEVIENINSPLTIMVMGEFSTGKSTFINALMGEAITKVDAKPTTAVITKLVYGERDRIVVHYQDGSAKEYGRAEFEKLTAEADAQSNELHERMDYVERTLPIDMLKSMSIIDSPGLNSIKSVHEDMTRHFMDKADTVLWMFDANKPGSQTEIDALKRLNPRLTPLVLVNKIDGIDEEEGDSVEGILEGVERRLENNKIEAQGYLGISAKMAFKGKTENRDKLVKASNIGAFYGAIEEKVLPSREQYKRNSLLDGLVKMIYGVGRHIKELWEKNEERKGSDYAAYVEMETGLATVWDELENIADIMLTDIEQEESKKRKRHNPSVMAFKGLLYLFGILKEKNNELAREYLEKAAFRCDEAAQICLAYLLWHNGDKNEAKYWIEKMDRGCPADLLNMLVERENEHNELEEEENVEFKTLDKECCNINKETSNKFNKEKFKIGVVGLSGDRRGAFINALLGKGIMPINGYNDTTYRITRLFYGEENSYKIVYENGEEEYITKEKFFDYKRGRLPVRMVGMSLALLSMNLLSPSKGIIKCLEVEAPVNFCKDNVELIDDNYFYSYLLQDGNCAINDYDAIIVLVSMHDAVEEFNIIKTLIENGRGEELLIVIDNKANIESKGNCIKKFVERYNGCLSNGYAWDKHVFCIDSYLALNHRRKLGGKELGAMQELCMTNSIEESGVLEIEEAIREMHMMKCGS